MTKNASTISFCETKRLPDAALVNIREACDFDGVSLPTGWRRVKKGIWPVIRNGGRTRLSMGSICHVRSTQGQGGV